jgi:hypothetical protein
VSKDKPINAKHYYRARIYILCQNNSTIMHEIGILASNVQEACALTQQHYDKELPKSVKAITMATCEDKGVVTIGGGE